MRHRSQIIAAAAATLAAVGTSLIAWHEAPPAPAAVAVDAPSAAAADLLATLTVAPPAPMTGYDRDRFGDGWIDVGNGCDTRALVLHADLSSPTVDPGGCRVTAGTLHDPWTGETSKVTWRGVDIDHVVALADAWRSGAAAWPESRRVAFANDVRDELVAVDASVNRSKGDDGPADWQPATAAGRCVYATLYVTVKARYGLTVTPADKAALETDLQGC